MITDENRLKSLGFIKMVSGKFRKTTTRIENGVRIKVIRTIVLDRLGRISSDKISTRVANKEND